MGLSGPELIARKRDGQAHSPEEIQAIVRGALDGSIPDYQLTAWLMAVYFRGLDDVETQSLTRSFIESGETLDFGADAALCVDKHSTGGVGDKTSLIVAPMVAAAGGIVPMISGRGLGHTGGTLDKLESIPGFRTALDGDEFQALVHRDRLAIVSAGPDLAPADRLFYALRDVTATVESTPLIVASILSKKVAEGIRGLVLDVKTGDGAFMKDVAAARALGHALTETGRCLGKNVRAVISDMSQPLGHCIGNGLEVIEAVEVLEGRGPSDLERLCVELAAHMLCVVDLESDHEEALRRASMSLRSGSALEKFRSMVTAQGGSDDSIDKVRAGVRSCSVLEYTAEISGTLCHARADLLGKASLALGAGRVYAAQEIDPSVGIELGAKVGDRLESGDLLAKIYYRDTAKLASARPLIEEAFVVGDPEGLSLPPLIHEVLGI